MRPGFVARATPPNRALMLVTMRAVVVKSGCESESESFGVSAVEAQAAGVPVIISDIPGLMEATDPGVTSFVVPRKNIKKLADAIIKIYDSPEVGADMAKNGRYFVNHTYELNQCFYYIMQLYQRICEGR